MGLGDTQPPHRSTHPSHPSHLWQHKIPKEQKQVLGTPGLADQWVWAGARWCLAVCREGGDPWREAPSQDEDGVLSTAAVEEEMRWGPLLWAPGGGWGGHRTGWDRP